jgi:hypothetical protein
MNSIVSNMKFSVKWDECYYVARCLNVPVYGIGSTQQAAIDNMQWELKKLYDELNSSGRKHISNKYRTTLNEMVG